MKINQCRRSGGIERNQPKIAKANKPKKTTQYQQRSGESGSMNEQQSNGESSVASNGGISEI